MKIFPIVTSLLILGIASTAMAAPVQFKNYDAKYTLRYDGIPFGKSTTSFRTNNKNQYTLCIDNKTTVPLLHGQVSECSKGILTSQTIKPITYDYDYKRNGNHEHIHIDFDWKKQQAIMTTPATQWRITIPENTQDKISYQLLIRRGLANGITTFSFPVADGGKLKTYQFTTTHTKNNLIKLNRKPMPSKENVAIWFKPDLDYLVTKVEQHKQIADVGTAELDSYTWNPNV